MYHKREQGLGEQANRCVHWQYERACCISDLGPNDPNVYPLRLRVRFSSAFGRQARWLPSTSSTRREPGTSTIRATAVSQHPPPPFLFTSYENDIFRQSRALPRRCTQNAVAVSIRGPPESLRRSISTEGLSSFVQPVAFEPGTTMTSSWSPRPALSRVDGILYASDAIRNL